MNHQYDQTHLDEIRLMRPDFDPDTLTHRRAEFACTLVAGLGTIVPNAPKRGTWKSEFPEGAYQEDAAS